MAMKKTKYMALLQKNLFLALIGATQQVLYTIRNLFLKYYHI
jgi:hypothetical protein